MTKDFRDRILKLATDLREEVEKEQVIVLPIGNQEPLPNFEEAA